VWKTCALVGNSGALLLREDGEEIDKHDMVLRFNTAPTKGYEKQVWKTCAVVGNSGALLLREDGEEIDKHDMVLRFNTAPTKGYEKQ
ncbi:unnamed protein product, partial [Closterium sp. NIES-54]